MESFRTKEGDDVFSVDRQTRVRLTGFNMSRGPRDSLMSGSSPELFPARFVVAENDPAMLSRVICGGRASTGTEYQRGFSVFGHNGAEEDVITPNYRTGVSQSGNGGPPENALRLG